jgi:hypothetical protein
MILKTIVDSCSRVLQPFPADVKRPELEVNHSSFSSSKAKKKWRQRVQFLIYLIRWTETNLVVHFTWVVKTASLQIVTTSSFTDVSTKDDTEQTCTQNYFIGGGGQWGPGPEVI